MPFQVDGIITYTPEGKINCTIVDMENKQKYTIDQSSITKTAAASEEDIAKLSGTQSGDVRGLTDDSKIESTVDASDTRVTDEKSGTQDTVAENINTQIKDKEIPNVTKLEFVLQKSPETSAVGPEGTGDVAEKSDTGPAAQVIDPAADQVIDPTVQETGDGQ